MLEETPTLSIKSIHIQHSDVDRYHNQSMERLIYWTAYPRDQCTWEGFEETFPLEEGIVLGQSCQATYTVETLVSTMLSDGEFQLKNRSVETMHDDVNLGCVYDVSKGLISLKGTIARKHFNDPHKYAMRFTEAPVTETLCTKGRKKYEHTDWVDLESLQVGGFDDSGEWKPRGCLAQWCLLGFHEWSQGLSVQSVASPPAGKRGHAAPKKEPQKLPGSPMVQGAPGGPPDSKRTTMLNPASIRTRLDAKPASIPVPLREDYRTAAGYTWQGPTVLEKTLQADSTREASPVDEGQDVTDELAWLADEPVCPDRPPPRPREPVLKPKGAPRFLVAPPGRK